LGAFLLSGDNQMLVGVHRLG